MAEAFGTLLKSWRNARRMSQLELGVAANVSARHISFLETGRARPSRPMVLALSETLNVPRANRNRLLAAAGFANAYVARSLDDRDMAPVQAALDWMLERHDPYPAIALDRHWTLVATNRCSAAMLAPLGLAEGDSLLEALIGDGPFAQALENRDEVAGHVAMRLQTESAYLGGDPILDRAAARLGAARPPDDAGPSEAFPAVIAARFRLGDTVLSLFSTIAQFGSTEDIALADLRIELMFPADPATHEMLVAGGLAAAGG